MECAMVLGKRGMRRVHLVDDQRRAGRPPALGDHAAGPRHSGARGHPVPPGPDRQAAERRVRSRSTRLTPTTCSSTAPRSSSSRRAREWAADGLNGPTHGADRRAEPRRRHVLTPEQLVVEGKPAGERVVVYDTDGYYMGATMAEQLAADGSKVTYITPFDTLAPYLRFTLEEQRMYQRLVELGVEIVPQTLVLAARARPGVSCFSLGGWRADDRARRRRARHPAQLAQRPLRRARGGPGPPRRGRDQRRLPASATPGRRA